MTTVSPALRTAHLARLIVHHRQLGSTNDRALALSKAGARHGLAVVADAQSAGRGQRGRHWSSQPGHGLYVSFVLRTNLPPALAATTTLAAGVAVRRALATLCSIPLGLKWPNDVLVAESGPRYGRKLAGILFEVVSDRDEVKDAILGIGINLRTPPDTALEQTASSLQDLGASETQPLAVLTKVANHLEQELDRLEAQKIAAICQDWSQAALGIGQHVEIRHPNHSETGTFVGLDHDGALLLDTPAGRRPIHHGRLALPGVPGPNAS